MATIQGQAGVNLSQELATYLSENQGNYTSEQLTQIINQYLSGGDKLGSTGGQISNGIYKSFGEFDQITGKVEVVTTGLWSGDTGSLRTFYTSSAQVAATSGKYYYNVYDTADTSSVQFSIAYGNRTGLGSPALSGDDTSTLETKATYAQYKQILLETDDSQFTFVSSSAAGTHDSDAIYVINVARGRYKEKMDAGNWSLKLTGTRTITLIDDSGKKFSDSVGKAGRVFNVVEGRLNLGTEDEASTNTTYATGSGDGEGQGFGLFYPDQGLIVLNPNALQNAAGSVYGSSLIGSVLTNASAKNQQYLFDAIAQGADFEARRTENVSTSHYFVRATNREFNFSNNPSFITGSDGSFAESTFETNPNTFITTVGLYNNSNEMIAVAKTSQPIPKSFDKEVLIKVKLDF